MYTDLPTLSVVVSDDLALVTVPTSVNCAVGGSSAPLVLSSEALPFMDAAVTLLATEWDAEVVDAVDPSLGLTPPGFDFDLDDLVVGYVTCDSTMVVDETKTLTWGLTGTNALNFDLSGSTLTVTV